MIDTRRLQVLAEVARQGSFNRAAAVLRLTPSAVSQQIAALERTVGTPVVRRSTRGVELTDAGRVLVETAESIAAELLHAHQEIERLAGAGTERLTVATFTSGGQRLLPAALTRFTAEHPGVELTVIESEPEESLELVRTGAADLALAYHFDGPPPSAPGLLWTPLAEDPMWIVLPDGHRLTGRSSITLAELALERWVLGCLRIEEVFGHYAALAGFEVRTACRGTDYQFAQSLVRAGVGISMIPEVALTADRSGITAIRLAPPGPCRFIGTATPRRRSPNPMVAEVMRLLRETVTAVPVRA
ncbi:LysR substrate-binding domain-containing protein [Actinoplanes sp. NPDC023714]|uniref:LysR family transcriptional regulator n=1 Tax=Actinoplanes sp. NPDC023714 TaxID=3154322 RepID=UPI0033C83C61